MAVKTINHIARLAALLLAVTAGSAMATPVYEASQFDLQGSRSGQTGVTPDDEVSFQVDARGYTDLQISFTYDSLNNNTENADRLFIFAGGQALHENGGIRLGGSFDLITFVADLTALDNLVFDLVFQISTSWNDEVVRVRDMVVTGNRLTQVSEPATVALFGLGLGLVAFGVRRRRR